MEKLYIVVDPETISKYELNNALKNVYVKVRKTDNIQYKKSSALPKKI